MRYLFCCLLAGWSVLLSAWAGPVEDLIKKAGTSADYPDDPLVTVFDSTRVEVRESGLSYFYVHTLQKVLTPAGALTLSVVKYDYDPLSAYAEIKKVVIYRKDGKKEVLDISKVVDYAAPARAIYWGAREKMLGVGRLEPGDAVEIFLFKKGFTYALLQQPDEDDKFIPPMKGHFYDIVNFWAETPFLEKVYQVSLPKSKTLQYEVYGGNLDLKREEVLDNQIYTFTSAKRLPMKVESGMVAKSDVELKLLLSTSPDWQSKSLWFYGVNEDFGSFDFTPEIKAKVDEILRDARNETDSISLLTHWCADEIRYSGISMGEGEGFTLHKGDMTFTDRCGVCKDKAGMLITMLRAAGFKSYPAMTMAGSRIDRIPADQFNHCVTVVKRKDGNYQLLDPTWVPFLRELWSSAEQQQNYLMGVPEGAGLEETPLSPPEFHYLKIDGHSEVLPDGTLRGGFILIAEGQSDAAVRRIFTGNFKALWRVQLEKELLQVSPLATITRLEYGEPLRYLDGPVTIMLEYNIPRYATVTPSEIIFTPVTASNLFKGAQAHLSANTSIKERKYPFRDRCSRKVELTETIRLPQPCRLLFKPEPQEVKGKVSSYSMSCSLDNQTLLMKQDLSLGKRVYDPADWPDYRQVVINQNQVAEEKIILSVIHP